MHKNFEIIPFVAKQLKVRRPELDFKFIITLAEQLAETKAIFNKAKELGVEDYIETRGQIAVAQAVQFYKECHIAFIPTLLETFSATFPEAMAAGLPIVTTEFDFAKDVSQDTAKYFLPSRPDVAAQHIIDVSENRQLRHSMNDRGKELVANFPDSKNKYFGYKKFILKNIGTVESYR